MRRRSCGWPRSGVAGEADPTSGGLSPGPPPARATKHDHKPSPRGPVTTQRLRAVSSHRWAKDSLSTHATPGCKGWQADRPDAEALGSNLQPRAHIKAGAALSHDAAWHRPKIEAAAGKPERSRCNSNEGAPTQTSSFPHTPPARHRWHTYLPESGSAPQNIGPTQIPLEGTQARNPPPRPRRVNNRKRDLATSCYVAVGPPNHHSYEFAGTQGCLPTQAPPMQRLEADDARPPRLDPGSAAQTVQAANKRRKPRRIWSHRAASAATPRRALAQNLTYHRAGVVREIAHCQRPCIALLGNTPRA